MSQPRSLEARVAERRKQLEARTTEKFDVPGYEGVFQVELQLVGGKRRYALETAHESVRDEYQRTVRIAADLINIATVGFHSVVNDEGATASAEGCTWKKLAKAADETFDTDAAKGRVAIVRLLGEEGVLALASAYGRWTQTRGVKVERDLEDFS